jgi:hypothetical protein
MTYIRLPSASADLRNEQINTKRSILVMQVFLDFLDLQKEVNLSDTELDVTKLQIRSAKKMKKTLTCSRRTFGV